MVNLDENMLKYMCLFYNGNLDSMIDLWKAADGFGIDVKELEERIIAQLVFYGGIPVRRAIVSFTVLWSMIQNRKLTVSFMKMLAYKYLIKNIRFLKRFLNIFTGK